MLYVIRGWLIPKYSATRAWISYSTLHRRILTHKTRFVKLITRANSVHAIHSERTKFSGEILEHQDFVMFSVGYKNHVGPGISLWFTPSFYEKYLKLRQFLEYTLSHLSPDYQNDFEQRLRGKVGSIWYFGALNVSTIHIPPPPIPAEMKIALRQLGLHIWLGL